MPVFEKAYWVTTETWNSLLFLGQCKQKKLFQKEAVFRFVVNRVGKDVVWSSLFHNQLISPTIFYEALSSIILNNARISLGGLALSNMQS